MKILFKLPKIIFSTFLLILLGLVLTIMYNIRFVDHVNKFNSVYHVYRYGQNIGEDYKEVIAKIESKDVSDEAYIKSLFADVDENTQKIREAQPYLPSFAKKPCEEFLVKLDQTASNREHTLAGIKTIADPSKATLESVGNLVK